MDPVKTETQDISYLDGPYTDGSSYSSLYADQIS